MPLNAISKHRIVNQNSAERYHLQVFFCAKSAFTKSCRINAEAADCVNSSQEFGALSESFSLHQLFRLRKKLEFRILEFRILVVVPSVGKVLIQESNNLSGRGGVYYI